MFYSSSSADEFDLKSLVLVVSRPLNWHIELGDYAYVL